ncbi:MAG: hypothetical protein QM775_35885 [Pirellulales bacterium]
MAKSSSAPLRAAARPLRQVLLWSVPIVAAVSIYSLAGGAAFRGDAAVDRVKKEAAAISRELSESADDPWAAAMRERFTAPTAARTKSLQSTASAAVETLAAQIAEVPDGAIQRKRYQLPALAEQLKAKQPDGAKLRPLVAALQAAAPPTLEPARRAAEVAVTQWFTAVEWTPQHAQSAAGDIAKLAALARRNDSSLKPADETAARAAFRRLAQTHLADDLLGAYRAEHSTFNYRTQLAASYVEQESVRHFSIPVNVRQTAGGFRIGVRGTADADAVVDVVPNPSQAEIHVHVQSLGRFSVSGVKDRLRLQAANTQTLRAVQTVFLTDEGVQSPSPQVCDRSCTQLCWVDACLRLPLIERLVERIAVRVAAKKLAEQDPVIARKVEEQAREKINDEALDIGHRINGKFGRLTSEHFPDDGDKPRLTTSSTNEAVTWTAMYADYDDVVR